MPSAFAKAMADKVCLVPCPLACALYLVPCTLCLVPFSLCLALCACL
jgi:hypothetical protein